MGFTALSKVNEPGNEYGKNAIWNSLVVRPTQINALTFSTAIYFLIFYVYTLFRLIDFTMYIVILTFLSLYFII